MGASSDRGGTWLAACTVPRPECGESRSPRAALSVQPRAGPRSLGASGSGPDLLLSFHARGERDQARAGAGVAGGREVGGRAGGGKVRRRRGDRRGRGRRSRALGRPNGGGGESGLAGGKRPRGGGGEGPGWQVQSGRWRRWVRLQAWGRLRRSPGSGAGWVWAELVLVGAVRRSLKCLQGSHEVSVRRVGRGWRGPDTEAIR